jgi:hypothetical protein
MKKHLVFFILAFVTRVIQGQSCFPLSNESQSEISTIAIVDNNFARINSYQTIKKEMGVPTFFCNQISNASSAVDSSISFFSKNYSYFHILEQKLPEVVLNYKINRNKLLLIYRDTTKYSLLEEVFSECFSEDSIQIFISYNNKKLGRKLHEFCNALDTKTITYNHPLDHNSITGAIFPLSVSSTQNLFIYNDKLRGEYETDPFLSIKDESIVYIWDTTSPLITGNYFVTDSFFIAAFDSNDVMKLSDSFHILPASFNNYVTNFIHQYFNLESRKIVVFNGREKPHIPIKYHIDLMFAPLPKIGNKICCLYSDPNQVYVLGDTLLIQQSKAQRIQMFTVFRDSFLRNYFDTLIGIPTILYQTESNATEQEYNFVNMLYSKSPLGTNNIFLFPSFKSISMPMDEISRNKFNAELIKIQNSIVQTLVSKYPTSKAENIRFIESYNFESYNQGFLHCNFLPLYK